MSRKPQPSGSGRFFRGQQAVRQPIPTGESDSAQLPAPGEFLVRLRRPDGTETLMRVPGEHFDRVMALAAGEFGDKSIVGIE
jgi:hypothetical protein